IVVSIPARIVIVRPDDPLCQRLLNGAFKPLALVRSAGARRLCLIVGAVTPLNGEAVVAAYALHVSIAQVGRSIFADRDTGREIVHHRATIERASGKVVLESQDMSHFMACEQRNPPHPTSVCPQLRIAP